MNENVPASGKVLPQWVFLTRVVKAAASRESTFKVHRRVAEQGSASRRRLAEWVNHTKATEYFSKPGPREKCGTPCILRQVKLECLSASTSLTSWRYT